MENMFSFILIYSNFGLTTDLSFGYSVGGVMLHYDIAILDLVYTPLINACLFLFYV